MDDLYQELILEHYREPQNFGQLDNFDCKHSEANTSCGDDFTFYLKLDSDNHIQDISFEGRGCAVSTAAASILTEWARGKSISELSQLEPKRVEEIVGVKVSLLRQKCLQLSAKALKKMVGEQLK